MVIVVDLEKAMQDGISFYLSQNGVILTGGMYGFLGPVSYNAEILQGCNYR